MDTTSVSAVTALSIPRGALLQLILTSHDTTCQIPDPAGTELAFRACTSDEAAAIAAWGKEICLILLRLFGAQGQFSGSPDLDLWWWQRFGVRIASFVGCKVVWKGEEFVVRSSGRLEATGKAPARCSGRAPLRDRFGESAPRAEPS